MSLSLILLGFLLYWVLLKFLDSRGYLPKGAETAGPILLLKTSRGKDLLERLARPKKLWRVYGNIGLAVAVITMIGTVFMLLYSGYRNLIEPPEPTALTDPKNVLVIPGVNDFLPLAVAPELIGGLLIGLIVHEGGHGVMARVEDVGVKSMGPALLAFIPVGAFVEQDEEEVKHRSRGAKSRIFAAGVTNNFVISIVTFVLLAALMMAVVPVTGVGIGGVIEQSNAEDVGIQRGDIVKSVNGKEISDIEEYRNTLRETSGNVEIKVKESPDGSVDRDTSYKTLSVSLPSGVKVRRSLKGYPAYGILENGDIITSINGEKIQNSDEFSSVLEDTKPGDEIQLTYKRDDSEITETITLAKSERNGEKGFLGVSYYTRDQIVGMVPYDHSFVASSLSSLNPIDWIVSIYLPFGATGPQFSGFHGFIMNFYTLSGALSYIGFLYWGLLNLIFWTAWINFNVAVLNCIPMVPLDGGRIFKEMAEGIASPFSKVHKEKFAKIATGAVAILMFGSIFLSILGPRILG